MRPKRAKAYKKVMQFYQQNHGFREPYQILVSPEFVLEGAAKKIDIVKALEEVVGGRVRLFISHCGIRDVRTEGPRRDSAIATSKQFEKRRCPHRTPIAGAECTGEIVGPTNQHNYCVATQDDELRKKLRKISGMPLIHISHSVVVLEPVPKQAKEESLEQVQVKMGLPELERKMIKTVKTKARDAKAALAPRKHAKGKKGKGPKGPNPLSVQKSKKTKAAAKKATGAAAKKATGAAAKKAGAGTKRPRDETQDGGAPSAKKKAGAAKSN
ncbi:hypothetical protein IW136_002004 [Coemansia sp. RSA 678]|nr:hypothetical protein IW136_002004 [Coemansia sp. RSA 678]